VIRKNLELKFGCSKVACTAAYQFHMSIYLACFSCLSGASSAGGTTKERGATAKNCRWSMNSWSPVGHVTAMCLSLLWPHCCSALFSTLPEQFGLVAPGGDRMNHYSHMAGGSEA